MVSKHMHPSLQGGGRPSRPLTKYEINVEARSFQTEKKKEKEDLDDYEIFRSFSMFWCQRLAVPPPWMTISPPLHIRRTPIKYHPGTLQGSRHKLPNSRWIIPWAVTFWKYVRLFFSFLHSAASIFSALSVPGSSGDDKVADQMSQTFLVAQGGPNSTAVYCNIYS